MTRIHDSYPNPRAHFRQAREFVSVATKLFALMGLVAGLSSSAFAGLVPSDFYGTPSATLNINQADGTSWAIDMSYMLTVDPSTGNLVMPATGSTLPTNWSWTKVGVLNPTTGLLDQKDGVMWHSDEKTGTAWDTTITFYGAGNIEPFLSYGFSARNATNFTQNYAFTYGESIVPPVSGSYSLYSDIAGSVTNAVNGTPARIAPTTPDQDGDGLPEIQALKFSTDDGATLFDAGTDVGPTFQTGPGVGTSSYGVYSSTLTGSAGAPIDYWQFETRFSLTPGKDAAALSGFADLEAIIPEPSTYAALLAALVLGAVAMRRNKLLGSMTL